MAVVLGLSFFFHDSAAALVIDGQIVAAAAEERFSRRKHTNEFPKHAIEFCLQQAGLTSVNDLDAIVFYEKPITKLFRVVETIVKTWPRSFVMFTRRFPKFLALKTDIYGEIRRKLPGYGGEIFFSEHHLSHAASAFYCSPFEEAAILTIDGVGEWETTTIGYGRGKSITLQKSVHFPDSVGILYSALTSFLGFKVNDAEWKVMGLAPYGKPTYVEQFRKLVTIHDDGSFTLSKQYFVHEYSSRWTCHLERWEQLFSMPMRDPKQDITSEHQDLAHSGQIVVEEIIAALARAAKELTGMENLVIAGGVGLNCVANWKLEERGYFKNIWIQPAAGDDGGALGAALLASQTVFNDPRTSEMTHAYFGPEYTDQDVEQFLELSDIPHRKLTSETLVEEVAELIAAGKVIGWSRGRMEFGPRALGARSILADATNPKMKEIINSKIKYREYFRPFAPVVPIEHAHEFFEINKDTSMPFMLKVPRVRADRQEQIPAVTHADNSARVQTLSRESNPVFHSLLNAIGRRTGAPVAVNTSFNIRGEPIVCSPQDAYNCFINTDIDALVINDFLITEKPVPTLEPLAGQRRSDELERNPGAAILEAGLKGSILEQPESTSSPANTQSAVLSFYKELPFNYYSNAIDMASELLRENRILSYPSLHKHLITRPGSQVLDVGCGGGWFVNSCAHFYDTQTTGLDLNPVVLLQARSVARFIGGRNNVDFIEGSVFEFKPEIQYDVVNSLGVLHHTYDCHRAIRQSIEWLKPGGYFHLGLYHSYGRKPFLDHFALMQQRGATEAELLQEFRLLNPDIVDEVHLRSWFRDQVLHPHETQHSFEEIYELLTNAKVSVEATSINEFRPITSIADIIVAERQMEALSKRALYKQRRYYPGFFVVWARKL